MVLMVAAVGGCSAGLEDASAGDTDDFIDQDVPPGNCSAGTTSDCPEPATTGSPLGGPCIDTNDCAAGNCIAPFIDGRVGDFTCVEQCIPLMDEGVWCVDDSACCDAGAVCSARGLCVIPEGGLDDSGTAGDSGTGSDDTGGTEGSGTAGGTEGSGTDGGSGTGGATGTTGMQ